MKLYPTICQIYVNSMDGGTYLQCVDMKLLLYEFKKRFEMILFILFDLGPVVQTLVTLKQFIKTRY